MTIRYRFVLPWLAVSWLGAIAPAWAQSASPPLNLQLPADRQSAVAASKPASAPLAKSDSAAAPTPAAPTVALMPAPYNETYGQRRDADDKSECDVAYTQPQVHGSVGMGVAAGNHFSGNYQTATIDASKALGSCDDPKGAVGASITVSPREPEFPAQRPALMRSDGSMTARA